MWGSLTAARAFTVFGSIPVGFIFLRAEGAYCYAGTNGTRVLASRPRSPSEVPDLALGRI